MPEIPGNNTKLVNVNSWFFPTKNYTFVGEFIVKKKVLVTGSDKLFSELIIHRGNIAV